MNQTLWGGGGGLSILSNNPPGDADPVREPQV